MKSLLHKPSVSLKVLLKAVEIIDEIFESEYFDAEINELGNKLNKKAKNL